MKKTITPKHIFIVVDEINEKKEAMSSLKWKFKDYITYINPERIHLFGGIMTIKIKTKQEVRMGALRGINRDSYIMNFNDYDNISKEIEKLIEKILKGEYKDNYEQESYFYI